LSRAETLTAKVGIVYSLNSRNATLADETIVLEIHTYISSSTIDVAGLV
jgi:hypothetical protein